MCGRTCWSMRVRVCVSGPVQLARGSKHHSCRPAEAEEKTHIDWTTRKHNSGSDPAVSSWTCKEPAGTRGPGLSPLTPSSRPDHWLTEVCVWVCTNKQHNHNMYVHTGRSCWSLMQHQAGKRETTVIQLVKVGTVGFGKTNKRNRREETSLMEGKSFFIIWIFFFSLIEKVHGEMNL